MRTFKKTLCFLVVAITLLSVSVSPAKTENNVATAEVQSNNALAIGNLYSDNNMAVSSLSGNKYAAPKYNSKLNSVFSSAWNKYQKTVDIKKYKVHKSRINDVLIYISDLYPEYFYLDLDKSRYRYDTKTGYVEKIYMGYTCSISAIKIQRQRLINKTKEVLTYLRRIPRTVDKVTFLHDYIVARNAYTEKARTDNYSNLKQVLQSIDAYCFTAYGCLINNNSVCQGMSDAFYLLCKKAGIKASMANSRKMVHSWNYVKVGNYYYHLDITWDDEHTTFEYNDYYGFNDVKGFVSHDYFMKSDSQINALKHYGYQEASSWRGIYAKDSNTYKNAYWKDAYSQIFFIKGYEYYMQYNNTEKTSYLIKRNITTKEKEVLLEIKKSTFTGKDGKSYTWYPYFATLAYNYKDNFLFINRPYGIDVYNFAPQETEGYYEYKKYSHGFYSGILYDGKIMYCNIATTTKDGSYYYDAGTYNFKPILPDYDIVYGDINDDGVFNSNDLKPLQYFILGKYDKVGIFNEFKADVNEDNIIDRKDLDLIKKALNGYNVKFGF